MEIHAPSSPECIRITSFQLNNFQVITMQDTFVSNEIPPSSIKIFHFLYTLNNYLPIRKYNTNAKQIHPNTSTFSYSNHIPIWKFTNLHHLNALESQASSDIHHPNFRFGMWLGYTKSSLEPKTLSYSLRNKVIAVSFPSTQGQTCQDVLLNSQMRGLNHHFLVS